MNNSASKFRKKLSTASLNLNFTGPYIKKEYNVLLYIFSSYTLDNLFIVMKVPVYLVLANDCILFYILRTANALGYQVTVCKQV